MRCHTIWTAVLLCLVVFVRSYVHALPAFRRPRYTAEKDLEEPGLNFNPDISSAQQLSLQGEQVWERQQRQRELADSVYRLLAYVDTFDRQMAPNNPPLSDSKIPVGSGQVTKRRRMSVLPPWQEFCRMLSMNNCNRFKRSLADTKRSKWTRPSDISDI